MAVVIDSGAITATRHATNVPQSAWPKLIAERRKFCKIKLPYDCRELLRFVEESHDMLAVLGYKDEDDFVRRGLDLDPATVKWAIKGLKRLKPNEPIAYRYAVSVGQHGGDHTSAKGKEQACNTRLLSYGDRTHILARLQRDGRAELLAEVYAGEKSANAAAIEAGYRKRKTSFEKMVALWAELSKANRQKFLKWADDNR